MPFVPLGARKRIEVILDDDKANLLAERQRRDQVTRDAHVQVAPGTSGYRFANHPLTMEPGIRGPDVPFKEATSSWQPSETLPDGPAGKREMDSAEFGAMWEGSHSLRTIRSSPSLVMSGKEAMEAAHPLTREIKRWEDLAHKTQSVEMQGLEVIKKLPEPQPTKVHKPQQGLVMFPKYMLLNNSYLKQSDLQRFQREQDEKNRQDAAAVEEDFDEWDAEASQERAPAPRQGATASMTSFARQSGLAGQAPQASWHASSESRQARAEGTWIAGNAMPAGRGSRTSNPFRFG